MTYYLYKTLKFSYASIGIRKTKQLKFFTPVGSQPDFIQAESWVKHNLYLNLEVESIS